MILFFLYEVNTVTTVIKRNVIVDNFHEHIIKDITSYNQVTVTTVSVLILLVQYTDRHN